MNVTVLGAGLTGLAAARSLHARGLAVGQRLGLGEMVAERVADGAKMRPITSSGGSR